jgi:hypothetical protein
MHEIDTLDYCNDKTSNEKKMKTSPFEILVA